MEFDAFKDDYREQLERSVSLVGQSADFFSEVKAKLLLKIAARHFPDNSKLKVLDVGCGIGLTDDFIIGKFGFVSGVDVAPGVIAAARESHSELKNSVEYQVYDGSRLPYPDGYFDIAFTICVLHHVNREQRTGFVSEMKRVTKKGGLNLIFEHNPYNPLTRYVVNRCPFDTDAILLQARESRQLFSLAGLETVELSYFLFFPWRGRLFQAVGHWLRFLPFGAQYVVVGRV